MHLFSRMVTARGNPRDVLPYMQTIRTYVDEHSPFSVSLWQPLFGAPGGSYAFSTIIESRATLAAGMAELMADNDYLDLVDQGQEFYVGPFEDRLVNIVHNGGGELRRADPGAAVEITSAQIEIGRAGDAIAWSAGMADLAASITGVPVHLGQVEHGAFGELQWTSTLADLAAVDRATEALGKDEDYIHRLEAADGLFVPGSGRQMLGVRIG